MKSGDRCWGAAIPFFALGVLSNTKLDIPDSSANNNARQVVAVTFLGDAPKAGERVFYQATPTIYRKPEAKGWGDTWGGRPVKLIGEKP